MRRVRYDIIVFFGGAGIAGLLCIHSHAGLPEPSGVADGAHGANAMCSFLIFHLRSYRTVSGCHWIFNEQNTDWNILWRRLWVTWPCLPDS